MNNFCPRQNKSESSPKQNMQKVIVYKGTNLALVAIDKKEIVNLDHSRI